MEYDEIDRVLCREHEIVPSSGFTASVMDAVRREAAAPAPIPFPWKRALPGLIVGGLALVLVLVTGVVAIARLGRASATAEIPMLSPSRLPLFFQGTMASAASWTVLALLVTLVSVKLSMRWVSGRA